MFIPQPRHIPKWKVFAFESAWGDDPEGGVVGCFGGEASEAVGEIDEDGMVVAVELFLHVAVEGFEAGAATADGFFEVLVIGSEGAVQNGIGVVEFAVDLRVEPKDFADLAKEACELFVGDGAAGIDGDADRYGFAIEGLKINALADEAAVEAGEVHGGANQKSPEGAAPIDLGFGDAIDESLQPGREISLALHAGHGRGFVQGPSPVGFGFLLLAWVRRFVARLDVGTDPCDGGRILTRAQDFVDFLDLVVFQLGIDAGVEWEFESRLFADHAIDHDIGGDIPEVGIAIA